MKLQRISYGLMTAAACLLTSCSHTPSSSVQEKQRVELSMNKVYSDLEEIKQDLNTAQMEMHILEGKLLTQDDIIQSIKKTTVGDRHLSIETLYSKVVQLEKQLSSQQQTQTTLKQQLNKLNQDSNAKQVAFVQYKEKLSELERNLRTQSKTIQDLSDIKTHLKRLASNKSASVKTYIVRPGDSLEQIARKHRTTIQQLKQTNHLKNDLIVVGQELILP